MVKKQEQPKSPHRTQQAILNVLQDLFIIQALMAGMNVEDIRKHLRVDKWRVSNISKLLKTRKVEQK